MMSMQDMFYAATESVWVVKPEDKKEEEEKKPAVEEKGSEPTALEATFGKYYPWYYPEFKPAPKPAPPPKPPTERTVELKVPICCEECVENIKFALKEWKGVKKVDFSIPNEKVTVVVAVDTTETHDLLSCCRLIFKKSRMWTADD